jgi:Glycogen debranching enzyme
MSDHSVRWLVARGEAASSPVQAYRLRFWRERAGVLRLAISADERYVLHLDGRVVARGPERGDRENWFFDLRELPVNGGSHMLVAIVWAAGEAAPLAQTSFQPGFYLHHLNPGRETDLSTGLAAWRVKPLPGHRFVDLGGRMPEFHAIGLDLEIDGTRHPWGVERGAGAGWLLAPDAPPCPEAFTPYGEQNSARRLREGALPAMQERPAETVPVVRHAEELSDISTVEFREDRHDATLARAFQRMLGQRRSLVLPARSRWRVLIDLQDYLCAYPSLQVSEGAGTTITLRWAEALHVPGNHRAKGNRDEIEGRVFSGPGDRFLPDGGRNRVFTPLWWRAGRYVQCEFVTADEPLRVQALEFVSTGYPVEPESRFSSSDTGLRTLLRLCLRSLRRCAHETYVDCPHYEQLMYVGDTRLEMLAHYTLCRDDRLQRKCIALFDSARDAGGMIASRAPARVRQVIPPFGFWWIACVHDHALWRDDPDFVRERLPGVRALIEFGLRHRDRDGLIANLPGWNFVDWAPGWDRGVPPDGEAAGGVINWQFVHALDAAAELEEWHGDTALAARCRRESTALARRIDDLFWSEEHGLFSDDRDGMAFSEHSQCLAVLSGHPTPPRLRSLRRAFAGEGPALTPCSLYFSHYWLEACRVLDLPDSWWSRLARWRELPTQGFLTTPEQPGDCRSDCHAWSAHPLFHVHATLLGVRPAAPGFRKVRIAPLHPRALDHVAGSVAHPAGKIVVELRHADTRPCARIELPTGVEGEFVWNGRTRHLPSGRTTLFLANEQDSSTAPRRMAIA